LKPWFFITVVQSGSFIGNLNQHTWFSWAPLAWTLFKVQVSCLSRAFVVNYEKSISYWKTSLIQINVKSIYIEKKVCLSVCLFFMHLDTVRANATKLFRDHPLIQEEVNGYFLSKKHRSSAYNRPAYVSDQWDCSTRYYRRTTEQLVVSRHKTCTQRFSGVLSLNLRFICLEIWLVGRKPIQLPRNQLIKLAFSGKNSGRSFQRR
jgi:hypothetical protein